MKYSHPYATRVPTPTLLWPNNSILCGHNNGNVKSFTKYLGDLQVMELASRPICGFHDRVTNGNMNPVYLTGKSICRIHRNSLRDKSALKCEFPAKFTLADFKGEFRSLIINQYVPRSVIPAVKEALASSWVIITLP